MGQRQVPWFPAQLSTFPLWVWGLKKKVLTVGISEKRVASPDSLGKNSKTMVGDIADFFGFQCLTLLVYPLTVNVKSIWPPQT